MLADRGHLVPRSNQLQYENKQKDGHVLADLQCFDANHLHTRGERRDYLDLDMVELKRSDMFADMQSFWDSSTYSKFLEQC